MPLILHAASIALLLAGSAPTPQENATQKTEDKKKDGKKKEDGNAQKKDEQKPDGKKKKKADEYPLFKLEDHPGIYFGKGTHLDFRGRFAVDIDESEAPDDPSHETASVDLGKKRLGISGEIRNVIEFQVEAELDKDDPWRDVYAEYKPSGAIRVRGGQFKLPFSLDENTSASRLDFMFRSLAATHLSPGRDQGVMVHGRVVDTRLQYEAGVFLHDGKNARTNNPLKVYGDQTLAGRVTYEPFRNVKGAATDLSIGAAFTTSEVPEGIPGLRGLMIGEQTFFSSADYLVKGTRRRTGVEMQLRPGPASVKAEWMRVETERLGLSVEDTDLSPLIGEGWYVSGTYAITGEKKSRVDRPAKPLFRGGPGAIEVGARLESLAFRSGASGEPGSTSPRADVILGNRNQVTTLGVNWYVNRFFKVQVNFMHESLDDPSQGPLPPQAAFVTKAVRLQVSF